MQTVQLLSIDIGTTTCGALLYEAQVERHSVAGVFQLQSAQLCYQSKLEFTPLEQGLLDEARLFALVQGWIHEAAVDVKALFGGGVIITGNSARKANAVRVSRTLMSILPSLLIHTINDPGLEGWLAFKGCIAPSNRAPLLNLDIGGGTTNAAYGENADVRATGCYQIGARHFRFVPGTYRLVELTEEAQAMLHHLYLHFRPGDELPISAVTSIARFLKDQLTNILQSKPLPGFLTTTDIGALPPATRLNISGGVGHLVFKNLREGAPSSITPFGDLGEELARVITEDPFLRHALADERCLADRTGADLCRATALGLALHNTQVSSNTVFIGDDTQLPALNLPCLGRLQANAEDAQWQALLKLQMKLGGALYIDTEHTELSQLKACAHKVQRLICGATGERLMVYLLPKDSAASFGNYLSAWRTQHHHVLVLDNMVYRNAAFISIGRAQHDIHPVSFYGAQHAYT